MPLICLLFLVCLLAAQVVSQQSPAPAPFERIQLSPDYYSEGVNFGDFNQDGILDLVSGPFWWEGPGVQHRIYPPLIFSILSYSDHFFSFPVDVNGDGWTDLVTVGLPGQAAYWYENPQQGGGLWLQHLVFANVGAESPSLQQLVAGGPPELICASGTSLGYLTPDPAGACSPWVFHPIASSPIPLTFLHGLGVGDINGDGRLDVLTGLGWLEQPVSLVGDPAWPLHPYAFGVIGGAQMFTYDVDGDGDNDIVSSIHAHAWGLSWFEQTLVGGVITFIDHMILPPFATPAGAVQFSQLHALNVIDVDGDGLRDIVTGKTFLAHNGIDPGALEPAVLYWFKLDRTGGTVTFTPHLIDDDSGVGRQVESGDLNGDGRPDLVIGNKKGIFVFLRSSLWADVDQISFQAGGSQLLNLNFGPQHASEAYWLLGSMSGTAPGVDHAGFHLALNLDSYTGQTILAANTPILSGFQGSLSVNGTGSASINLPAAFALPGPIVIHHACVVWDGMGALVKTSNPASLTLF